MSLAEFGQFVGRELAGFDEVGGEAAGGAVEDAVDEFADHRLRGGGLRDGGRPLMAAGGLFATHEAFVEHDAEHRGDGRGGDFALAAERFADVAERGGAAVPEDAEDFEFAVGRMLAGGSRHDSILFVVEICGRLVCGIGRPAHNFAASYSKELE